ncbi:TraM recognition domain-containing protein [Halorubrum amylolyticum]|uniref:TraM recognition domain-containing protein n=1 Tax=Halorubrum amylolyticum TaxID=2508724 RepID=UPI0010090234|nr:TraM recognition domain-containing protein [Halorubrum amylolyticum]
MVFEFLSGDDDESSGPITNDDVAQLHNDLELVAGQIEQRRLSIEDRVTISEYVETLLHRAAEATDDKKDIEWYATENNPTTDQIAEELRDLIRYLTPDRFLPSAGEDDIEAMRHDLGGIQQAVEEMEEFDYAYVEEERNTMYGEEIQSIGVPDEIDPDELDPGEDGQEVYAAGSAREVLEEVPREYDDAPLFVGKGTRNGRDASIEKNHLFRHRAIFGVTGYGKSTLLTNDARQLIESGAGLCFIDPKGDDARRLMKIMPEHRVDDVVWIEPGATGDYLSGFNFISLNMDPERDEYNAALASLVEDLKKMLAANDDYWGPRMDRVAQSIITGMNLYNSKTPDDAPEMNFVDMYYVLKSEASRHEFTARLKEAGLRFITPHMETVAEMPEDDLEPLLGRFLPWIQNPVARRMIGFRSGGVSIPDAIDNDKIIIVRMGSEPRELKQMLGMAVIRRIWSHIRGRAAESEHQRSPFYLFADEFDNLAMRDDTIPSMISESRSYRLAMTLANQYPSQLPSNVVDAITTNCDTIMSFNPGDKKSARTYSTQLGLEPDDLTEEVNYHYWMRTTISENMERSDAFRVYAYPPFPPVRDTEARDAEIQRSLQKVGRERRSDEQVYQNLLFNEGGGRWETGIGRDIANASEREAKLHFARELQIKVPGPDSPGIGGGSSGSEATPTTMASGDSGASASGQSGSPYQSSTANDAAGVVERHLDTVLESVFAARLRAGKPADSFVPTEDAKDELVARLEDSTVDSLSELSNIYERVNSTYAETKRNDGTPSIKLTPKGRGVVLQQDTGSAGSGGGDDHRWILGQCYVAFTQIGYVSWLPEQEGEEMPDGVAEVPIDVTDVDENQSRSEMLEAIDDRREQLREEYPGVWNFAGADDVSIEAETSTIKYPFQTFTNLRKAMEKGEKCVFAVKDGTGNYGSFTHWGKRAEQVIYETEGNGKGIEVVSDEIAFRKSPLSDGSYRYYNDGGGDYRVGDEKIAVRPHREADDEGQGNVGTVWYRDAETDEVVAAVGEQQPVEDGEIARFDSPEEAHEGDKNAVPAYYEYNQSEGEYVVYNDGEKLHYPSKEELEANWVPFRGPFIPEARFPEWPDNDDFEIIIFPDSDNDEYDQPQLYHRGECTPLFDHLGVESVDDVDAGEIEGPGEIEDATSDEPVDEDKDEATAADESGENGESAPESEADGDSLAGEPRSVEGFTEPPTPARIASDERIELSVEKVADAAEGAYKPPKQQRVFIRSIVNALRTDPDDMAETAEEAINAIVLPEEIEPDNEPAPESTNDSESGSDDAEDSPDTAADERGDTDDSDGSESDETIGTSPKNPGLSHPGYRTAPTPTQIVKDDRVELTPEEVAAIARGEREMSGNEGMVLGLILRQFAEGSPEYTPDEVREEIIIPPDGVGAFATDGEDTAGEDTPASEDTASSAGESDDEDDQSSRTEDSHEKPSEQAEPEAESTGHATPTAIAESSHVGLSPGVIQAFAADNFDPSPEQVADIEAAILSITNGEAEDIQTRGDVREAIELPTDYTPKEAEMDRKDIEDETTAADESGDGQPDETQTADSMNDGVWGAIIDSELSDSPSTESFEDQSTTPTEQETDPDRTTDSGDDATENSTDDKTGQGDEQEGEDTSFNSRPDMGAILNNDPDEDDGDTDNADDSDNQAESTGD